MGINTFADPVSGDQRPGSPARSVSAAVLTRQSVRGYLDRPVDGERLRRIVTLAARAPSGCNLQPWFFHVVSGEPLEALKWIMRQCVKDTPQGEPTQYDILPAELPEIYNQRRFDVGFGLYDKLGIARSDREARGNWHAYNYNFFGAPVGLFCSIDRRLGLPQWADMGMALQTIMLLLREEGLDSCPQEAWSLYPETVGRFLDLPPERMLFCGMAIGYRDPDNVANHFVSERAELDDYATFIGI